MKLLIMQFPPISRHMIPLFSNTLSLCSSLNVRDQVSHPYRTTVKIKLSNIVFNLIPFLSLRIVHSDRQTGMPDVTSAFFATFCCQRARKECLITWRSTERTSDRRILKQNLLRELKTKPHEEGLQTV
jgi:hypothetical protein